MKSQLQLYIVYLSDRNIEVPPNEAYFWHKLGYIVTESDFLE